MREFVTVQKHWWDLCHTSGDISASDLAIIQAMWTHSNEHTGGWSYLSIRELASIVLKSERAVARSLSSLERKGHVEVDRRDGRKVRRRPVVGRESNRSRTMTHTSWSLYSSFHSSKKTINPRPQLSEDSAEDQDMPLFDIKSDKPSKKQSEASVKFAKELYNALSTCVGQAPKRHAWKRWAVDFERLMAVDGIESTRIEKVLSWICLPDQIRKTKARSGRMFRAMFDTLEALSANHTEVTKRDLSKQEQMLLSSLLRRMPDNTSEDISEAIVMASEVLTSMSKKCRQNSNRIALQSLSTLETILLSMVHRLQSWDQWSGRLLPSVKKLQQSPELKEWCERRDIDVNSLMDSKQ